MDWNRLETYNDYNIRIIDGRIDRLMKLIKRLLALSLASIIMSSLLVSCVKDGDLSSQDNADDGTLPVVVKEEFDLPEDMEVAKSIDFNAVAEFEDGELVESNILSSLGGYSGSGYVDMESENSSATVTIDFPETGLYNIVIRNASNNEFKENDVLIDGNPIGSLVTEQQRGWQEFAFEGMYIEKGERKITVKKSWGWTYLDCVKIMPGEDMPSDLYDVKTELINENASDNAKRLMKYLDDSYGEYVLTGQYAGNAKKSKEFKAIANTTGRYPAICGFDLIEYSPSRRLHASKSNDVENAIDWWEEGGIVTFAWHWNAPSKYLYKTDENPWWKGFYKEGTFIDLGKIMNGGDPDGYDLLISDIDAIAKELKKLEDAGVPVLWRPLHEASGGWFWWGTSGPQAFKDLWRTMYRRLTEHHGINNLIWLWNGQDGDWYPGDEYVDMIGEDIYPPEHDYSSQKPRFNKAVSYTDSRKVIALSENGVIPDVDLMFRDGAIWSWFAVWEGDFVLETEGLSKYSEKYTEAEKLIKIYNHKRTITLDELPNLKEYPLD